MDNAIEMKTVTLCMPAVDVKFLNALSKRMGWKKVSQNVVNPVSDMIKPSAKAKKTELDLALEDVQKGDLQTFKSVEALMDYLNS